MFISMGVVGLIRIALHESPFKIILLYLVLSSVHSVF